MNMKKFNKPNFSRKAINKTVLKDLAQSPGVVYPITVGILSLVGAAALLPVGWLFTLGGVGIVSGGAYLSANYGFNREKHAQKIVNRLFQSMEEERKMRTTRINKALDEVGSAEGKSQFDRVSKKFNILNEMLSQKLIPGELTYSRYLAMAEQVYLGVLDNLQDLANTVKSINTIEVNHIEKRLTHLKKDENQNDKLIREQQTLIERLDLRNNQLEKAQGFLSLNEEAMTNMDKTIAAITEMRTEDDRAEMELESAMNRLQDLATRAKDYNKA